MSTTDDPTTEQLPDPQVSSVSEDENPPTQQARRGGPRQPFMTLGPAQAHGGSGPGGPGDRGHPRLFLMADDDPDDWFAPIDQLIREYDSVQSEAGFRLADLHGLGAAKQWAENLVRDLRDYKAGRIAFTECDAGCVLAGPPGTGKTTLARILAREAGVTFIATSAAPWLAHSHLGDVLKAVKADFEQARASAPCILFIDEVDGLSDRAAADGHHKAYWTSFVTCILEEMSGFKSQPGIVVLGATNNLGAVDPALLRSGRFDRVIQVHAPSAEDLARILRQKLGAELPGADLTPLAVLGLGGTGADAERWVRGAKRRARYAGRGVELDDLAVEVGGGVDALPPEVRRRCAVHEAGHGVAAVVCGEADDVAVSLGKHSGHAGATRVYGPPDQPLTAELARRMLVCLLAGRAAEEIVLGEVTAGAGGTAASDLSLATHLAVRMIASYGLAGPSPLVYLGANVQAAHLPPHLLAEVRQELSAAYKEATALVLAHRPAIEHLAVYLVDHLAASDADIRSIVQAHSGMPEFTKEAMTRH